MIRKAWKLSPVTLADARMTEQFEARGLEGVPDGHLCRVMKSSDGELYIATIAGPWLLKDMADDAGVLVGLFRRQMVIKSKKGPMGG